MSENTSDPSRESAATQPRYRVLTVGRRTYRKVSRLDRRRKLEYAHPELRLSNKWLSQAGISAGDRVAVWSPRPGLLAMLKMKPKPASKVEG